CELYKCGKTGGRRRMTDKERLEELETIVKFQIDNDSHYGRPARALHLGHDASYLIEPANQFKEMKREFADDIDFKRRQVDELREQNEYNKQALINQEKSSDREIERLRKRVQELEDIIYQDARQGMIEDLYEENKRYRETIKSVRSEIKYALYSNKSEDVKRHYLQNAEREATEALEGEGE